MLDTLSLSINEVKDYKKVNSFEFEIFAAMYDRDIIFAKFEIFEIFEIFSFYLQTRFVFSSRVFSFSLRFVFVVVELI